MRGGSAILGRIATRASASTVPMSPQRRTALVSVFAALVLIGLKLAAGIHAGSLGLLSEAAHSGTDLVAALLTFFAVGVAGRPADPRPSLRPRQGRAPRRACRGGDPRHDLARHRGERDRPAGRGRRTTSMSTGSRLSVIGIVIVVDASRALVSARAARRYAEPGFCDERPPFRRATSRARRAVLVGLLVVARGHPQGDAIAALFVSVLVLAAASRLIKTNVDVLMDRFPHARGTPRARRSRRSVPRPAPAAAHATSRGPPFRRRRHRRPARRPRSSRATLSPTPSRRPSSAPCPEPTSSCTSSPRRRRPCESARTRRPARPARARGAQHRRPRGRRPHRGLAPSEASGRALTR